MFRRIKKWYFKLYHLIRFLGIFILIFGIKKNVYAEECKNLLEFDNWLLFNGNYILVDNNNKTYWMTLPKNTTYTIFFNDGELQFNKILTNQAILMQIYYESKSNGMAYRLTEDNSNQDNKFTFTTSKTLDTRYYIKIRGNNAVNSSPFKDNKEYTIKMVKGENVCEEKENQENEVYSNFLTLYTEKINYLANGFTTNPYLLAMIGIIFTWVVLEITLKLFKMRGGK